ncbi:hypothetical protein CSUB01_09496 [Colletotrichum sublineola]|uniref:Uncharacterized protein n=1 Tax=Colletotrichum sublineola TaxID=1173701 RepID=A0A066X4K8_COLSU|nr:hypothetical protein CSUB01_09496 [Colletotrichum sublineola]
MDRVLDDRPALIPFSDGDDVFLRRNVTGWMGTRGNGSFNNRHVERNEQQMTDESSSDTHTAPEDEAMGQDSGGQGQVKSPDG